MLSGWGDTVLDMSETGATKVRVAGMPRPVIVTFRVTEAEHEELRRAGRGNVSDWMRSTLLAEARSPRTHVRRWMAVLDRLRPVE